MKQMPSENSQLSKQVGLTIAKYRQQSGLTQNEVAETVRFMSRKCQSTQPYCIQGRSGKGITQTFEFFFQESVIKIYVVCYENSSISPFNDFFCYFIKFWGIGYHVIRNAS